MDSPTDNTIIFNENKYINMEIEGEHSDSSYFFDKNNDEILVIPKDRSLTPNDNNLYKGILISVKGVTSLEEIAGRNNPFDGSLYKIELTGLKPIFARISNDLKGQLEIIRHNAHPSPQRCISTSVNIRDLYWYETGGAIVWLLLFWPVGLYAFWLRGGKYRSRVNMVFGYLAFVLIFGYFASPPTTTSTAKPIYRSPTWNKNPTMDISRAIVRKGIYGCGQYEWFVITVNRYKVRCTSDGYNWVTHTISTH